MLTVNTTTNTLTVAWTDTQEDLEYTISYTVSARTVSLFSSGDIPVTNTMLQVSGTMFTYSITNATYFVEGVVIAVSVTAVNDTEIGPSEMSTLMVSGSKRLH